MDANAIVRAIALDLFEIPPTFHHLMLDHLTSVTIVAVGTAVIVFAVVVRHARRSIHLYRRMAVMILTLSFIPDVALFFVNSPGYSPAAVFTLMVLHVVDAARSAWGCCSRR